MLIMHCDTIDVNDVKMPLPMMSQFSNSTFHSNYTKTTAACWYQC